MSVYINCIIKWTDSGQSERVLCLDPAGLHYYCIDIRQNNAWPLPRPCADVEADLRDSRAVILEHDELAMSLEAEHALSDRQRHLRDRAWDAIQYLISDETRAVMDRRNNGHLIKAAARRANLPVTTIYKYLRRYWQRGQTINALQLGVPRFGGLVEKRSQGNSGPGQSGAEDHPYAQNNEPFIIGKAASARGIGDVYKVDVIIADVHVVDAKKRNVLLGRPIIYLVIDVFSCLVVGVHIAFDNVTRSGACDALLFAFSDKARSCADHSSFGINRTDWLANGLPRAILSDRNSEFLGGQFSDFVKILGIEVKSAPAYDRNIAAVSERLLRFLEPRLKWLAAVAVAGEIVRASNRNGGTAVCMTQKEFEGAILRTILEYNTRNLDRYSPTAEMIKNDVEMRPQSIWKWGLIRANYLRHADDSKVDLARRLSRETKCCSSVSLTKHPTNGHTAGT